MIGRAAVTSIAVLFLALAFPLTAQAQSIFVTGGAVFPTGDYGDFADVGWMVAGGVSVDIGDSGLFAGAEGLFSRSGTEAEGVSAKPWSALGFLGYSIATESAVSPYVWGGAGLQGVTVSFDGASESDSAFGYGFGAGVAFAGQSSITPLIEARFQGSSDDSVDLHFIGVSAGVGIRLGN